MPKNENESVTINVKTWNQLNKRKSIKNPNWFAFPNRLLEQAEFLSFDSDKTRALLYILCQCSINNSDTITVYQVHAARFWNLTWDILLNTINHLSDIGFISVIHECNTSVARVSHECNTSVSLHNRTEHNKTNITNISSFSDDWLGPLRASESNMPVSGVQLDLELIYKSYPRKIGKQAGLKKLRKHIKTENDFQKLAKAVENYAKFVQKTEPQFIKHFSTFAAEWQDWLEFEPEKSTSKIRGFENL